MDRRKFIKKAGFATIGAVSMPYILPSGRLFAASGNALAEHVVYVLFAGGVRQQEAVLQRYLADSQGRPWEGNIMYNMLNGSAPQAKIVYGTNPSIGTDGSVPIPQILSSTLQSQGLLFPEVYAANAGHYGGLNTLLTGNNAVTQGLRQKPLFPTLFEYTRRHLGAKATETWFVGNTLGNSVPLLNYSGHTDYGASYGANMFIPGVTFGGLGQEYLANAKIYHPEEELSHMQRMRLFLDNNYRSNGGIPLPNIQNTEDEKQQIKSFVDRMLNGQINVPFPPVSDNGDLSNIGYAGAILKEFKPKLLAVNMSSVDSCHGNFTGYLSALHRADHAVGHLWDVIQNDPVLANKTAIVVTPEHGRNAFPNSIKDENDWFGFDHSDANTRRVWTMMAGPGIPSNLTIGSEGNPVGRTTDNVLTIAEILGFKNDIITSPGIDPNAMSLFDRI
ncbi:MAG: hypothetical protein ACI8ZO_000540 [Flavobacteriales bacterium]|jgi:hypothetical protein